MDTSDYDNDNYSHRHEIRGFAMIQLSQSAALITRWFVTLTNHRVISAARHYALFEVGTTSWGDSIEKDKASVNRKSIVSQVGKSR